MCTGHKVDGETIPLAGTLGLQTFKPGWVQEFRNLQKLQENNKSQNLESVIHIQILLGDFFFCHFVIVILLLKALEGDAEAPGKPRPEKICEEVTMALVLTSNQTSYAIRRPEQKPLHPTRNL